jgi:hypothetical protein
MEVLTSKRQTGGRSYVKVAMCSYASFPLTIYQVMASKCHTQAHTQTYTKTRPDMEVYSRHTLVMSVLCTI